MGLIIGESVLFETYFTVKVVTKVTSEYSINVMTEPEVLKIIPAMKQYLKLVLPEITEIHLRKKY